MKVCIKGAAEQVKMGEIDDVCLDFDRILLATDGSEPAILATQYAVTLAKTLGASMKVIFVDDGMEKLEYPEEVRLTTPGRAITRQSRGSGSQRSWPSAMAFRSRSK